MPGATMFHHDLMPVPADPDSPATESILLVDDSPTNLDMMAAGPRSQTSARNRSSPINLISQG